MTLVKLIAAFFMVVWLSNGPVFAQAWPSKPVRFVVPYAAGGSGDVIGRLIGSKLTEGGWGQQVVLDNRPGAAGTIGVGIVARSATDGYTFLLGDDGVVSITPHIQKSLAYDPQKDFIPVVQLAVVEFVLTVHPSVAATSLAEFINLLKREPGKYSYASAGIGGIHHLSMEWFKQLAGVNIIHVPYKGSGQILPDVISGTIPITYTGLSQAMPHVRAGKLRALAIGGPNRLDAAPGVPSLSETFPGFNGTVAWNLFAPAGVSRDIVQRVNADVNRVLRDPEVSGQLAARGLFPLGGTPERFAEKIRTDYARWGKLISDIGVKAE